MMKGGKRHFNWKIANSANPTEKISECLKVTSLDVPLILGLKLLNLGVANIRVLGGPVASFVLNHSSDFRWNQESVQPVDFSESLEATTWGVQFGAGVDILMLSLDARYEMGLEEMSREPDNEFTSSVFMLTLGWKFQ